MASISVEELRKMKVADLKKELKDRGLTTTGTKDVLLERLEAVLGGTEAATEISDVDTSLEKSLDQLVGDSTPAAPAVTADPAATVITSIENIPATQPDTNSESDTASTEKKVVPLKGLSEADRLKARAQKFGIKAVPDSAKKLIRAERFGLPVSTASTGSSKIAATPATPEDLEKMKKRAERFGIVVSNKLSKVDEDEKKKKRMERFGITAASAPTEAKKVKLNSTDIDAEEKKRKRAERFGLT